MGRYRGGLPVPKSLVFMHSGQTNLTLSWALPRGKPLPLSLRPLRLIHTSSPVDSLIWTWLTEARRQTFIHTLNRLLKCHKGSQGESISRSCNKKKKNSHKSIYLFLLSPYFTTTWCVICLLSHSDMVWEHTLWLNLARTHLEIQFKIR